MATIESQDFTISQLFNNFYIVPSYQREYVWKNEQVSEFFEDIYSEFLTQEEQTSEYFIGSIIVCKRHDEDLYEVIDGQQRITTAYLMLCAIKKYCYELKPDDSLGEINSQIAATDIDQFGHNIFRYRVTLQYEDSMDILTKIAQELDLESIPQTTSVENIKNAYDQILKLFNEYFHKDEIETLSKLKRFYHYFIKKVMLVRVKTATLADALRVFATINYRGVNLNPIDLLKNLMFMEANKEDYETIKKDWKKIVDLLYNNEKPIRFIRYFLIAYYLKSEPVKENQIYDWFLNSKNKTIYQSNSVGFVKELLETTKIYINFLKEKDQFGQDNRYLKNLFILSAKARLPLVVLLAAKNLDSESFSELCKHIENIFFVYLITREDRSKFETIFSKWCRELRLIKTKEELNNFVKNNINTEKLRLKESFESAFTKMETSSVPKTQYKYILAKLTQYIDEQAYENGGSESNLDTYIRNVEIEHILPENPKPEVRNNFDQPDLIEYYTRKLGNLTLLEKSLNRSVSNKNFEEKAKVYVNSKFLLTKTIAKKVNIGNNTAVDRAVKDLITFDKWDSHAIEKRQKMLTELAKKVWEIP